MDVKDICDASPSKLHMLCYISSQYGGGGGAGSPLFQKCLSSQFPLTCHLTWQLMAEIQAPEDSVSFSVCVNLEMSKFFSVMLPIVKRKTTSTLSVDAERVGPFGTTPQWEWGGAHRRVPSTSHCTSDLFCVLFKIGYK